MQNKDNQNVNIIQVVTQAYGMSCNSYLIFDDDNEGCIVVDPSGTGKELLRALDEIDRVPSFILLTHAHFDHIMAIPALESKFGTLRIAVHEQDSRMLEDPDLNLGLPLVGLNIAVHPADILLNDGDVFEEAGASIRVMNTPGHTRGSSCFILGDRIITGDTLFYLGAGRSDTPGGDSSALIRSIGNLFALPGEYKLLPGHGSCSSMDFERKNNTFMKYYAPHLLRD